MTTKTPLVVLTSGDDRSWALINLLRAEHGNFPILLEDPEPATLVWKRRLSRFGVLRYAGMKAAQLAMGATRRGSDAVIDKIIDTYKFDTTPHLLGAVRKVGTVNSNIARETLRVLDPKVVLVLSTRPVGARTLECVDAPFVTFSPGVAPAYRGLFGAYFALARGEPELFGGTVHTLPKGRQPGEILYQSRVSPLLEDNIHTYAWRITACSRGILLRAIRDGVARKLAPRQVSMPSRSFDMPTLGFYLWTGLTRRVW